MKKSKKHKFKKTTAGALLFGLFISPICFFVSVLLGAIIANSFSDPLSAIGAVSFFSLLLCGAISGFCVSRFKGNGGILPTFLSSLVFALICLFIGLIMSGGDLPAVTAVNLLLYIVTACFFAFLAKKRERRHRRR